MDQVQDHARLFDFVYQPIPVPVGLDRDRRAEVPLGQELSDRAAFMAQPLFPNSASLPLDTRHRIASNAIYCICASSRTLVAILGTRVPPVPSRRRSTYIPTHESR